MYFGFVMGLKLSIVNGRNLFLKLHLVFLTVFLLVPPHPLLLLLMVPELLPFVLTDRNCLVSVGMLWPWEPSG